MRNLILTADQIFALAYILKAKSLDYFYVSLATCKTDDKIWRNEISKQLVSKGVLVEDFSGDTTIEAEIEDLVKPLYFSTKESSLEINIFGDNEDNEGYRFHFLDGKVTMTRAVKEGFEISEVTFEEIRELISGILPAGYNADSVKVDISLDISKVSRIFVVKNTVMSVKSFVTTLVESDGIVYEEDTEDNISSVSGSDFADKLYKILTEV